MHQNFFSSRKAPAVSPLINAPLKLLRNRAFELIGRGQGINGWQFSKSGKARGMRARCRIKRIVGFARQCNRSLGVEDLGPWLHVGDDLHVDAGGIHFLKAKFAEVVELARWSMRRDAARTAVAVSQFRNPKVLLDRNDPLLGRHCGALSILCATIASTPNEPRTSPGRPLPPNDGGRTS